MMLAQPMQPVIVPVPPQVYHQQEIAKRRSQEFNRQRRDALTRLEVTFINLSSSISQAETRIRALVEQNKAAVSQEQNAAIIVKRHLETALEIVSNEVMTVSDLNRLKEVLCALAAWKLAWFDKKDVGYDAMHIRRSKILARIRGEEATCEALLNRKRQILAQAAVLTQSSFHSMDLLRTTSSIWRHLPKN